MELDVWQEPCDIQAFTEQPGFHAAPARRAGVLYVPCDIQAHTGSPRLRTASANAVIFDATIDSDWKKFDAGRCMVEESTIFAVMHRRQMLEVTAYAA